jgi:hypothetical protein
MEGFSINNMTGPGGRVLPPWRRPALLDSLLPLQGAPSAPGAPPSRVSYGRGDGRGGRGGYGGQWGGDGRGGYGGQWRGPGRGGRSGGYRDPRRVPPYGGGDEYDERPWNAPGDPGRGDPRGPSGYGGGDEYDERMGGRQGGPSRRARYDQGWHGEIQRGRGWEPGPGAIYDSEGNIIGYENEGDAETDAYTPIEGGPLHRRRRGWRAVPEEMTSAAIYGADGRYQVDPATGEPMPIPEPVMSDPPPPNHPQSLLGNLLDGQAFPDAPDPYQGLIGLPGNPRFPILRRPGMSNDNSGPMTSPPQLDPTPLRPPLRQRLMDRVNQRNQQFLRMLRPPEQTPGFQPAKNPFAAKSAKPMNRPFSARGGNRAAWGGV